MDTGGKIQIGIEKRAQSPIQWIVKDALQLLAMATYQLIFGSNFLWCYTYVKLE